MAHGSTKENAAAEAGTPRKSGRRGSVAQGRRQERRGEGRGAWRVWFGGDRPESPGPSMDDTNRRIWCLTTNAWYQKQGTNRIFGKKKSTHVHETPGKSVKINTPRYVTAPPSSLLHQPSLRENNNRYVTQLRTGCADYRRQIPPIQNSIIQQPPKRARHRAKSKKQSSDRGIANSPRQTPPTPSPSSGF